MIEYLNRFFETYPHNLLRHKGVKPSELPDGLMDRLLEYKRVQLVNLEDAQLFRVDTHAFEMMGALVNEMTRDGLTDLFSKVILPFPIMIIQPPSNDRDKVAYGVVMQLEDKIYTYRVVIGDEGLSLGVTLLISQGLEFAPHYQPPYELLVAIGLEPAKGLEDEETNNNKSFLSIAVAIATLLRHDGMLKAEEVSLHSRQARRQAERSGRRLPDTVITRIALGKIGRSQVHAMNTKPSESTPRRTHWVRGHFMRSRSNELVWRMPHLRGAGPLINQVRHVSAESPNGFTGSATIDQEFESNQ